MSNRGTSIFAWPIRWILARPGVQFLTASDTGLQAVEPDRFRMAWLAMFGQAVLWGVAMTFVWNQASGFFGDTYYDYIWIFPAAAVMAFMFLWPFRQAMLQTGRLLGRDDAATSQLIVSVLLIVYALALVAAKPLWIYGETYLPPELAWVRPGREAARVLLLMPLWGCWGMLIAGGLVKTGPKTEPAVSAMVKGCGPICSVVTLLAPLAATWFYFAFMGTWHHLAISAFAVVTAAVAGVAMGRLEGGLSRRVLLATNVLVQLALLLGYLFAKVRMKY